MSGTRSHFLKAQATDALIVAHGQPSDPEPAENALRGLTESVQALLPDIRLGSATMASPGSLEAALTNLRPDGVVYPLFMANGWFTRIALPKRLGNKPCRLLHPLGLDPKLPGIAAQLIEDAAVSRGWRLSQTKVLLASHGSGQGKSAADSTYAFARALSREKSFSGIASGFVEQQPFLPEIGKQMGTKAVCMPFFAMEGDHMRHDVREVLDDAGFEGPVLPALGQCAGIPELIAAALREKSQEREAA